MLTLQLSVKFNPLQKYQPTGWLSNQPTNQPTKTVRYEVLRAVRIKITVFRMGLSQKFTIVLEQDAASNLRKWEVAESSDMVVN